MFSKVLVPININDAELTTGVMPYVARFSKDLGLDVVLIAVLDPENVEIPDFANIDSRQSEAIIPVGTVIMMGGPPVSEDIPVPGTEEASSTPREIEGESTTQIIENARFSIEHYVNRFASRLTDDGIQAEAIVAVNKDTSEEILKAAEAHQCDLIAMATRDRSLLGQEIMGSVTNDVVRSSPVPVVAITPEKNDVEPGQRVAISRIIVPLDGSTFAESVLPYVQYLAQKMSLEIILARSLAHTDIYPTLGGGAALVSDTGVTSSIQVNTIAEEDTIEYLRGIASRLEATGVRVSWEMLRGATSQEIADLAEATSNSMVALASRSRSGIKRWIFGSVAEELIRGTGEPVLVIPAELAEGEDQ